MKVIQLYPKSKDRVKVCDASQVSPQAFQSFIKRKNHLKLIHVRPFDNELTLGIS